MTESKGDKPRCEGIFSFTRTELLLCQYAGGKGFPLASKEAKGSE